MTKIASLSILVVTALLAACFGPEAVSARAPVAKRDAPANAAGNDSTATKPPAKRNREAAGGPMQAAGEPIEGFGARAHGGEGGQVVVIDDPSEDAVRKIFNQAARTGNVILRFEVDRPIEITRPLPHFTAPHVTFEGNGATLDGTGLRNEVALIDIRTNDVIVRNLRLRNGYDNLRLQGPEAFDIAVSHVSSTGSQDDGISVGYGAHDVTVQYVFLAGNTRSFFCKYETGGDVSLHHSWIQKGWIRNPLLSGAVRADVRNVIIEDWAEWGVRFENGASGNLVNSLFTLSPYAHQIGGKGGSALRLVEAGPVYLDGNVARGEADSLPSSTSSAPIKAPPVRTSSVADMEKTVRGRAGCLPRDHIDEAYIALQSGWHIGESTPLRDLAERPRPELSAPPRGAR